MKVLQLKEQLLKDTLLYQDEYKDLSGFMADGDELVYAVERGSAEHQTCFSLRKKGDNVYATGSYYIGIDWIAENELAIQVSPKMNDNLEIDYVRMLNSALMCPENFEHLSDLITIHFNKPSIPITNQQDILSVFLITEYLNSLYRVVRKNLKKSYYQLDENLHNKVKGRILIAKNVKQNLMKGRVTDNVCSYQVYDIDSNENRILKKALLFCARYLSVCRNEHNLDLLKKKSLYIKPFFDEVSDNIKTKEIKSYKGNPVYKEFNHCVKLAQLLLKRYSYDITNIGSEAILTPPFWIDMSKLFELYVYQKLRDVFTEKGEVVYHKKVHYQELDYLLKPAHWPEPYVIDAKYKPRYKNTGGITVDDARQVSGYARLSKIYSDLHLDEDVAPPIKCLIIYPDQSLSENFTFDNLTEPLFDKVSGYVRIYKVGIKLPEIKN